MSKKVLLSLTMCVVLNVSLLGQAFADEIVISGNGSGSENTVQVNSTQTTSVEQSNNSNVTNNVSNNADTGSNQANQNTGDTAIQTGDATSNVTVNNNQNHNAATIDPCCEQGGDTVTIEGNGAGSTNTVGLQNSNTTTTTQVNNANITNNISVRANTGNNTADFNSGSATIITGNIESHINVNNKGNTSVQHISSGQTSVAILVKENGAGTTDLIALNYTKNVTANTINNSTVLNNIISLLNTGNNSASGNLGDVLIKTGGIKSFITINNDLNNSFIHVDCECENDNPNPNPTPTITPPTSPTPKPCEKDCGGGGGNGGNNPSNGSVGGVSSSSNGEILPATGSYFLYLITLASLISFFTGWYLRFRSGLAPGKK